MEGKVHYVSVTGIVRNSDGRYLICKRSDNEKAFPGKWCVPGGKVEMKDFVDKPKDTSDHWLDIFEKILEKEISEETGLKIKNIGYCSSLVFIRPNGFPTIIVSLFAEHDEGDVVLSEDELVEHAWVGVDELGNYDLIENIAEQIKRVDGMFN